VADNFQLKAIISAVDHLSPALKGIQRVARATNKSLRDIGRAGDTLGAKLGLPLSLLGGATIASLTHSVGKFIELGSAVNDTAEKLGIGTATLQGWEYAAKIAGVPTESLHGSIEKLNKGMAEAAGGKNDELRALLIKLNIPLRDTAGHIRTAADVLPELADAFARNENPALRARMATVLFSKAGQDMIPLLIKGKQSLAEMTSEAKRLGIIMDEESVQAADRLGDSWDKLKLAARGLQLTIGARLAPVLQPLIDKLVEWIAANRELIAQRIEAVVRRISEALERFDWEAFFASVGRFIGWIERAVEAVGGWGNAFLIFAGIANAQVFVAIGQIIGAVYRLGTALWAFAANPVFLVIAAVVAALAAVAYLVYKNWSLIGPAIMSVIGPLAEAVQEFLSALKECFAELWAALSELIALLAPVLMPVLKVIGTIVGGVLVLAFKALVSIVTLLVKGMTLAFQLGGKLIQFGRHLFSGEFQAAVDVIRGEDNPTPALTPGALQAASQTQRLQGEMVVRFEGAPPGMRVDNGQTNQPGVDFNPDVGYRSLALGIP